MILHDFSWIFLPKQRKRPKTRSRSMKIDIKSIKNRSNDLESHLKVFKIHPKVICDEFWVDSRGLKKICEGFADFSWIFHDFSWIFLPKQRKRSKRVLAR